MSWALAVKHVSINRDKMQRLVSCLNKVHQPGQNVRQKIHMHTIFGRHIRSTSSNTQHSSSNTSNDLYITLPDLSSQEVQYVRQQVDIILNPLCLQHTPVQTLQNVPKERKKGRPKKYSEDVKLQKEYVGGPVDLCNPEHLKTIFPNYQNAGSFHNLNVCTDIVRRAGYPSFVIPNSKGQVFKRNFRYPLLTERIVASLQTWGVTNEDLIQDPSLVISSFSDLAKYGKTSKLFDIPLLEAKSLYATGKNRPPLRGHLIREKIRLLEDSLKLLGFSSIAEHMTSHASKMFSRMRDVNISGVDNICASTLIQELIDMAECSSEDVAKYFKGKLEDNNLPRLLGATDAQVSRQDCCYSL